MKNMYVPIVIYYAVKIDYIFKEYQIFFVRLVPIKTNVRSKWLTRINKYKKQTFYFTTDAAHDYFKCENV